MAKRSFYFLYVLVFLFFFFSVNVPAQPDKVSNEIFSDASNELREIIKGLSSVDPAEQERAAIKLGEMGSEAAPSIPFLIRLLAEQESIKESVIINPAKASVDALTRIGDSSIDPLIEALLWNEDMDIRANAAIALGRIGGASVVEALIQVLTKTDESWIVRANAAMALGETGDAYAVQPLIWSLEDEHTGVRGKATVALGKMKDGQAVKPLMIALKDDSSFVRGNAAWALGEIKDTRSVEALINSLNDKDAKVRGKAALALREIRDPRAVGALIAGLKDENRQVRVELVKALGGITGKTFGLDFKKWQIWWELNQ